LIKKVKSFAKINLFLYVTSKRKDGYHNLDSLMVPIDLFDDIYFDFSKKEISITCDHPDVPEDESNLAYKAAELFYSSIKSISDEPPFVGLSIKIIKRITPGGGLGGGSSNAAAVLLALNNHYKKPFSNSDLRKIGLELGADVPFFIFGGAAIARGVGERLETRENLRPYHLVLCDPGIAASTAKVYKNIDFRLTSSQKYNKSTGLNMLSRGQEFDVKEHLHNDLEESACRLYPAIKETKEEMQLLLHRKVLMTGSGSSLFALFSSRKNAESGCERLLKEWKKSRRNVILSSFD